MDTRAFDEKYINNIPSPMRQFVGYKEKLDKFYLQSPLFKDGTDIIRNYKGVMATFDSFAIPQTISYYIDFLIMYVYVTILYVKAICFVIIELPLALYNHFKDIFTSWYV